MEPGTYSMASYTWWNKVHWVKLVHRMVPSTQGWTRYTGWDHIQRVVAGKYSVAMYTFSDELLLVGIVPSIYSWNGTRYTGLD